MTAGLRIDAGHVEWARRLVAPMRAQSWSAPFDGDDVDGAAMVGLMEAAARWDPASGTPFETFAAHRVRGAVRDGRRRMDHLSKRHRRSVTGEAAPSKPASLDAVLEVVGDVGIASSEEGPEVVAVAADVVRCVDTAVSRLKPRHQLVVRGRYAAGLPNGVLGAQLGVTEARVSQIHGEALDRLRSDPTLT